MGFIALRVKGCMWGLGLLRIASKSALTTVTAHACACAVQAQAARL